jgi:hypothetical protein
MTTSPRNLLLAPPPSSTSDPAKDSTITPANASAIDPTVVLDSGCLRSNILKKYAWKLDVA